MPTALIVEDEPAANQLLSMLVRLRGYETDSAFSGSEALKKAEEGQPDLVFLDLMLPDINGYEVCKALKDRRSTANIPVVMVTARLANENRVQGFRAGAVEYVPKPYTPDQIFGAMSQAMSQAMSWRSRIDAPADTGLVAVDVNDEVAYLRHVSELRALLLFGTRLDEPSVGRLVGSVLEILQRAVDWARSRSLERPASFGFRLDHAQFALTIRDDSGWLADDDPSRDGLAELLDRAGFDRVEFLGGRELRLTTNLPDR